MASARAHTARCELRLEIVLAHIAVVVLDHVLPVYRTRARHDAIILLAHGWPVHGDALAHHATHCETTFPRCFGARATRSHSISPHSTLSVNVNNSWVTLPSHWGLTDAVNMMRSSVAALLVSPFTIRPSELITSLFFVCGFVGFCGLVQITVSACGPREHSHRFFTGAIARTTTPLQWNRAW